jgi:hypothetical protein
MILKQEHSEFVKMHKEVATNLEYKETQRATDRKKELIEYLNGLKTSAN